MMSLYIYFFLTHSIFKLLFDIFLHLLLLQNICSFTFYATCFCHAAFCSMLLFFVCFLNCFHLRSCFQHYSACPLFLTIFFYFMVHSYLPFSVRQFSLLFYSYMHIYILLYSYTSLLHKTTCSFCILHHSMFK